MVRRLGLVAAALMLVAAIVPLRAAARPAQPAGRTPTETVDVSWFGGVTPPLGPGQIELRVASGLPSTVTGEDARVEVRGLEPGDTLVFSSDRSQINSSLGPAR